MNPSMPLENQLLVTKFYIPVKSGSLISRPRLTRLLDESLKYPLTLVSAAAGFGKTTLLASWSQSFPSNTPRVAWVSLDEEDNSPRLFWTYVLTALNRQVPERFTSLLLLSQSPQPPPLNSLLAELINALVEGRETFLLILDDYHLITEHQVHTTLTYLIEHLPPQLRIIIATRTDPALPLAQLRARKQVLEVRTPQLCCTAEETKAFLHEVMGLSFPDEIVQEVTMRTEGWLVGLQLLGLSLSDRVNPTSLLKEISGDQCYILDYLTEEVLGRQPQEVQTFLLCTSILEGRLTASLCDAVMEQTGSQEMLHHIEQANLFVVSLDSKRQWYHYHDLFAQALRCQLERRHADLVPLLHHRASTWYAQQGQTTEAILHAFKAHQWQWATDLIEGLPLLSLMGGADEYKLTMLQEWLEQLPADVIGCRPRLCLACTQILWSITSHPILEAWLDIAEARLTASLTPQTDQEHSPLLLAPHRQQDLKDLLAEVMAWHAFLWIFQQKGQATLILCQQARSLLSAEKHMTHALINITKAEAYSTSGNDAEVAIHMGIQAISLAHKAGLDALVLASIAATVRCMIGAGRLHEAERLVKQGLQLGTKPTGVPLPQVGWIVLFQAEILREWNQLDAAQTVIEEAIGLCQQVKSIATLPFLFWAYAIQMRIFLSRTEMDAARSALEQLEQVNMCLNQPCASYYHALFVTGDQVRLWLACGEVDQATHWVKQREIREQESPAFGHEREEVACVRVLLATAQPDGALQRLSPMLQRATVGQRWGHVIEMRLLQALALQMLQEETQALAVLAEAVRLAEPEGYIRSFVDEGVLMESLLYQLRRRNRQHGPTPYLDMLLAAFQQERRGDVEPKEPSKPYQLPQPLSVREREVLHLLASGTSNQEIAQELVIAVDTVKRHTSHIFSKLGVHNRTQAMLQARELGLLDEQM
jgi:LuxR family maltose regulon positive regulatory protein